MSPTAFTATMAATTRPLGSVIDAVPILISSSAPRRRACRPSRRRPRRSCLPRGAGRRGFGRLVAAVGGRADLRVSADAEIEQDRGRHDRDARRPGGPADVVLLEPAHGAGGGVEAERAAAGEDDRVHLVDHVERVQQIRFARARRAAALRDAADRVAVDENHRAAGRALGEREVADLDAGDRGDRRVGVSPPGRPRSPRGYVRPAVPKPCESERRGDWTSLARHGGILERPAWLPPTDRILAEVDRAADEIVQFTADLVRIPTVNPPGEEYEACARFLGDHLKRRAFEVEYIAAEGRPEHTARHPRVNVVGSRRGGRWPGGPPERAHRRRAGRRRLDRRSVRRPRARRQDLRARRVRHEGGHRRGGVRRRSDRARRRAAAGHDRDQRHGGRRERRLRRRRVSRRARADREGAHRLRHHSRAAQRRSHLHRPSRRVLVRGDRARADRTRQHAVSGRQRDRRHGPTC